MRILLTSLFLLLAAVTSMAQRSPAEAAREELNLGVREYRSANYEDAEQHFQRAILLDDTLCVAKLYLATTFAQEYVPGVNTKDNLALAGKAIAQYQQRLACKPDDASSWKGIAFLKDQLKKWNESREAYRQALKLDDKDPETYYAIGVIDWQQAFGSRNERKSDSHTLPDAASHATSCSDLRERNLPFIEDGLQALTKAVELRKDYDDAMVYMNLLYRERAKMECEHPEMRKEDIRKADQWSELAMDARRKKTVRFSRCAEGGTTKGECSK